MTNVNSTSNTTTGRLEFLDDVGNHLASALMPDEMFIEGRDREVKHYSAKAIVTAKGRISQHRFTSNTGDVWRGGVSQGTSTEMIDGTFFLDRVDVLPGEEIRISVNALTIKDEVLPA